MPTVLCDNVDSEDTYGSALEIIDPEDRYTEDEIITYSPDNLYLKICSVGRPKLTKSDIVKRILLASSAISITIIAAALIIYYTV